MKVDNFVSNRLKNYIWYISVTTRPPKYVFLATPLEMSSIIQLTIDSVQ